MAEHITSGGPHDDGAALSRLARELLDDRDVGDALRDFHGRASVADTIRGEISASSTSVASTSRSRRTWRMMSAGVAIASFAFALALIGTSTWAAFASFAIAVAAFDRTFRNVADPSSDDALSRWLGRTSSRAASSE